jgi:hypothetical protein
MGRKKAADEISPGLGQIDHHHAAIFNFPLSPHQALLFQVIYTRVIFPPLLSSLTLISPGHIGPRWYSVSNTPNWLMVKLAIVPRFWIRAVKESIARINLIKVSRANSS